MTPTECAYVAGIIDGEGWVEYKRKKVRRNTRPGKPIHNVLIIRLEVPQVDGRLIDYLMATTDEGNRDMKHYPTNLIGKINIDGEPVITACIVL
jgi:hypothetical protein